MRQALVAKERAEDKRSVQPMNIFLQLPLIICLGGLLIYLIVKDGKVQELARLAFMAGLLSYLLKG